MSKITNNVRLNLVLIWCQMRPSWIGLLYRYVAFWVAISATGSPIQF